jgi:hypothetical protein
MRWRRPGLILHLTGACKRLNHAACPSRA